MLLQTKLYIPPLRPNLVPRPHLIERLNQGLTSGCKLTLVSAPAGFGKSTLLCAWAQQAELQSHIAWLALDASDNDLTRFLTYFVAALQTIESDIGQGITAALQSPGKPNIEADLTTLLNEIAEVPHDVVLILDDYHAVDVQPADASTTVDESTTVDASTSVDGALSFLLEHLPPQMHLVIATREDPALPLARLRVRGQLTELRVNDLRFTPSEAAEFLNQVMDLNLSAAEVAALENRTEGWIAGLQMAALSMQGRTDSAGFIQAFTGSHHFVLDYLVEEVLHQQPATVHSFLLRTSILDRLCGPLCDALLHGGADLHPAPTLSGQETLEHLERANLFLIPLDDERRWYRYHHLFADLLRRRLQQSSAAGAGENMAELHGRASDWYEENGLEIEAFHHAVAANDIERAARLIEAEGVPLQYRGAAPHVLNWLETLPTAVLDARPSLWVTYASALNFAGLPLVAEQKLQAAEAALQGAEPDDKTKNIVGHIAAIRAMIAVGNNQLETIIAQSRRALEYLHPDNLPVRTITTWTLGYAYQVQGDRAAASQAYAEVLSISQASGDVISTLAATTGLGNFQESDNQLFLAAESYRHGLQLFADQPQPFACDTYFSLARILYEWNDLDAAQEHARQSIELSRQMVHMDTFAICGAFLARLKLTQGDAAGAAALLAQADQFMRQHGFVDRLPEVVAVQVLMLLQQDNLTTAADLAKKHELPISQARVHLAQGDAPAALAVLRPYQRQVETDGLPIERLKVLVLLAVALHTHGEMDEALQSLDEALVLAQPGGFIRTFVDEGPPMAQLLQDAASHGIAPDYVRRLLSAFPTTGPEQTAPSKTHSQLIEPLSPRELEVLQLVAQGLSNREISERLFLALNTVKGHNRNIFSKLGVQRRTEAVARARELDLL